MTPGQWIVAVSVVGALLVGALVPEKALLLMGLCVAGVGIGAKFVP